MGILLHLHSEGQHAEELIVKAPGMEGGVTDILPTNDPNDESYFPHERSIVFKMQWFVLLK
jgi:hypothetical protein